MIIFVAMWRSIRYHACWYHFCFRVGTTLVFDVAVNPLLVWVQLLFSMWVQLLFSMWRSIRYSCGYNFCFRCGGQSATMRVGTEGTVQGDHCIKTCAVGIVFLEPHEHRAHSLCLSLSLSLSSMYTTDVCTYDPPMCTCMHMYDHVEDDRSVCVARARMHAQGVHIRSRVTCHVYMRLPTTLCPTYNVSVLRSRGARLVGLARSNYHRAMGRSTRRTCTRRSTT